jgi:hypothetical protein
MKHLEIPEGTHCRLMQYKAQQKLKTAGKAIDNLLDFMECRT